MELSQYQIVLVNLEPTIGSEMNKTRPCVIISPNEMNDFLRNVVIAPMTSSLKKYPSRVDILHNNQEGAIALDQIKTIDKQRIVKILGQLQKKEILKLKSIIKELYVD